MLPPWTHTAAPASPRSIGADYTDYCFRVTDDADLPHYDDLPIRPDLPAGSSWGLWGDDDALGCLNLLTPERVQRAASLVRTGTVFPLSLPMHVPDPPLFGRAAFAHEVRARGKGIARDDVLDDWNTQSSTQWDGFKHIRNPDHGYYNGLAEEIHGVHHWAERGIAGRAVVADVATWRSGEGRPVEFDRADAIDAGELAATLEAQGSTIEVGDVLLVRTGWIDWYHGLTTDDRAGLAGGMFTMPGLAPSDDLFRLLWDWHIAALAVDNPAVEAMPIAVEPRQSLHTAALTLLGLPLGELWDLDALAEHCRDTGRYDALLTSAPLWLVPGVASPPNAMAIV